MKSAFDFHNIGFQDFTSWFCDGEYNFYKSTHPREVYQYFQKQIKECLEKAESEACDDTWVDTYRDTFKEAGLLE